MLPRVKSRTLALLAATALSCGTPPDANAPRPTPSASGDAAARTPEPIDPGPAPAVRLPTDVRPTDEAIELRIVPSDERFSGKVDITVQLEAARGAFWLHGRDMNVTRATVTPLGSGAGAPMDGGAPIEGKWEQRHPSGVASLVLPQRVPAGRAKIHIEFDAPIGTSLKGLYRAKQAGESYVFTQFEAIAARQAFPCFDEPAFKIPFTLTLVVPAAHRAVANTKEAAPPVVEGAMKRFAFKPTPPLPSYLVAFAVGPIDVVEAQDVLPNMVRLRPLPLRGVAAKGRGPEMAYALAHTGEILGKLEEYFGIEYPYDKLDILAVPDREGAMENPGAITFKEWLVLVDEKTASLGQKRAFAGVMAHELAHMWFGDLVTMAWWDDTWLNEAFATWMGNKAVDLWDPKLKAHLGQLGGVQGAMGADSLVSARAIRQPIQSTHDIENAFDTITYQKGGGVLSMFERWIGPDKFKNGVRAYLAAHKLGNAAADDFLGALSDAAGRDVKTSFHTFLDQPGVPFVEAELECKGGAKLHVKQSRYLPIGSSGDAGKAWQIPICARYPSGKETKVACALVGDREGDVPLEGACPAWVFPNADAAGYFRFALAPADLAKLKKDGLASLSTREKIAFGNSLRAGYNKGTTPFADALGAAAALVGDENAQVAGEPMGYVASARDWFWDDAAVLEGIEAYGRALYGKTYARLGWTRGKGEDDDATWLRQSVIGFLALTARDPAVRAEAKKRGLAYLGEGPKGDHTIHKDAVDPNLAGTALAVVGQEMGEGKLFDAMLALLAKTQDEDVRGKILWALGSAKNPGIAASARALALDPRLRVNEVMSTLWAQLSSAETRDEAYKWILEHYDALVARISSHHGGARLIGAAGGFCTEADAKRVESFFATKVDAIEGGPRVLASTLENIRLCVARRGAHERSARAFFAKK